MILIVSHFTKNKGTTDYLLDYFKKRNMKYYLLRHPFYFTEINHSELFLFDGEKEVLLGKYKKINNKMLDLIRNYCISLYISLKLRRKIDKIICFGSFNSLPFITYKKILKRKLYFWGVDYSKTRFNNNILNRLYQISESLACKHSELVIQPTERQEAARVKYHNLKIEKSLILPNGIDKASFKEDEPDFSKISLIYIGSITKQHGIIDFVKYFYVKNKTDFSLYIFGGGECENELMKILIKNNICKVVYFGTRNQDQIIDFIKDKKEKLLAIAPYNIDKEGHAYYGDSLKIKEYLSYNISYITHEDLYINEELIPFGYRYKNLEDLNSFLKKDVYKLKFDIDEKNQVLEKYTWDKIFDRFVRCTGIIND